MSTGGINYYQKEGNHFEKLNNEVIPIISNSPDERDVTKYAAIFTHNDETYKCNMIKMFERLEIISEVYSGKYQELLEYYSEGSETYDSECLTALQTNDPFNGIHLAAQVCTSSGYSQCISLINYASEIEQLNDLLDLELCVTIY